MAPERGAVPGPRSAVTWIGGTDLLPVEKRLVGLCHRAAGAMLREADLEPLAQADFRSRFRDLASEHRVAGLVLAMLQDHPLWSRLPPPIADELLRPDQSGAGLGPQGVDSAGQRRHSSGRRRSFDELCSRATQQDRELERLIGLLRAEKVEPVVLKGPALRRTVYTRPVERRYADFDLLFFPEHVDRAIDVVEAAGYAFPFSAEKRKGYRELHFHVLLRQQRRFRAELHWSLSRKGECFQLDSAAFWQRSVVSQGSDGTAMRVPCAEHLLLHMAHENLRDSLSRLSRIVDLDRIVASAADLDWDYLVSQARDGGLQTVLALSLELNRALLGTLIPPEVQTGLRPGAATRLHLGLLRPAPSLLGRTLRAFGPSLSLLFWLHPGWRTRWRLLLRLASGRRDAERWIFREDAQGPPPAREALVSGVKSVLALALEQASLYLRRLRRLDRDAPDHRRAEPRLSR